MEPQTQNTFRRHIVMIILLVIMLIIVGASTVFLYKYFGIRKDISIQKQDLDKVTPPLFQSTDSMQIKKTSILNRAQKASSTPLSTDERNLILKEFGPNNASQYRLTPAEKEIILKALNRQ